MIPCDNGSSSSLTVVLERGGTHLLATSTTQDVIPQCFGIVAQLQVKVFLSMEIKGKVEYPRGTALCNHR